MIARIISPQIVRLLTRPRYNYFTPFQKPVTSLALLSFVQMSASSLQFCHEVYGLAPQVSVMCGAFAFRMGVEFGGLFFQSLNASNKDNFVNRWIQKIFLVDLRRDVTFYQLPPQKYTEMSQYYKPEELFTNFLKSYSLLNFLRGAHNLISNPINQPFYSSIIVPLHLYDGTFVLPLFVIGLNYLILSGSQHPFMIHLVRKENKLMCFNLAFMSGLLFVASPAIYPLSYIGIAMAHLSMRRAKKTIKGLKQYLSGIVNRRQK